MSNSASWICKTCSYENAPVFLKCEMCQSPANKSRKKVHYALDKFQCQTCTFLNDSKAKECQMCGSEINSGQVKSKKQKPRGILSLVQRPKTQCPVCKISNSSSGEFCSSCKSELKAKQVKVPKKRSKKLLPPGPITVCEVCKGEVSSYAYKEHLQECKKGIEIMKREDSQLSLCHYCDKKFEKAKIQDHNQSCPTKLTFFDSQPFTRLTPLQRSSLIFLYDNSQKLHFSSKPLLLRRLQSLGYTPCDLQSLHHYLQNSCPLIIHVNLSRHLSSFCKDTHYRNTFELHGTNSARVMWQDRMFSHRYHTATPFERVKYGTVNLTNDPEGVGCCVGYGQSYFLLREQVRRRCTVTDVDSASGTAAVATLKFCYQVVSRMRDNEIAAAMQAAKAMELESSVLAKYKEIQVHGPVEFARDIQRVYVSREEFDRDPSLKEKLVQFCGINKLEYEVFEPRKVGKFTARKSDKPKVIGERFIKTEYPPQGDYAIPIARLSSKKRLKNLPEAFPQPSFDMPTDTKGLFDDLPSELFSQLSRLIPNFPFDLQEL